ncbi:S41 family peptidase [Flavobacterium sp.]|uniref:S41 family peptidase n=1 Tax=Flavobacterium sp. TaxID=239 RepID=UPI00122AAF56|nr:S41 family peptidase [Flavobacterium sp.]RZJ71786.1 MAG: peptidase S41 protein [Flavobacterium sp.]
MPKVLKLIFLLSICVSCHAQKLTAKDSISIFYDRFFSVLKTEYLLKNAIDWKTIESETRQNISKHETFKSALQETRIVFDKIGGTHCKVMFQNENYGAKIDIPALENFSEQWKAKNATKPSFEVKVLDGKYGYILLPSLKYNDFSPAYTHKIAQPLYDKIHEIKTKHKIEGWILDLRFNLGGNDAPMLLALYDFLGDNAVWGTLDSDKKPYAKTRLSKGRYFSDSYKVSHINPKGESLEKAKVAVITGLLTASSGEVTALAFKGRPNSIFIGEPTLGMTTANVVKPMPFDALLVVSIAYDCDRNGTYYEKITPDIAISKKDNFDDLLLDENILQAIKFVSGT